jgi:flavin reductase (DIM6/NTAB) family NADH-FMN oxidoreductase RutF
MSNDLAKALGKLSGWLYVVTTALGTARSAMITLWVFQASFEPLVFTVVVAKDRAIESLLQV